MRSDTSLHRAADMAGQLAPLLPGDVTWLAMVHASESLSLTAIVGGHPTLGEVAAFVRAVSDDLRDSYSAGPVVGRKYLDHASVHWDLPSGMELTVQWPAVEYPENHPRGPLAYHRAIVATGVPLTVWPESSAEVKAAE